MVKIIKQEVLRASHTMGVPGLNEYMSLKLGDGEVHLPKKEVAPVFYNEFNCGSIEKAISESDEYPALLAIFHKEKLVYPVK